MIKICFVCTGNTCRSIMAERLMKRIMKERKIEDVKVFSKGLKANGENIAENAKVVLKKYKALSSNRKSVKLGKVDKSMLYIVMTESMKAYINAPLVLSIRDLIGEDVGDPYGLGEDVYQKTALQIMSAVEILINKIKNWREK